MSFEEIKEALKKQLEARITLINARLEAAKGDPKLLAEALRNIDVVAPAENNVTQCGCNVVAGCG